MKIIGLIAEYNPFHNGHRYHIEKAKEITGADAVVVIMSGDFVQRGAPALLPKQERTECALKNGASLVIELPVCYATGSAEYFAYGAVSILEKLGCIDGICFGSECGDVAQLKQLSAILADEPEDYQTHLSAYLKQGNSFPLARQLALKKYLKGEVSDTLLSKPNNILGIEYLKAIYRLGSQMNAYSIKRISSDYHDTALQKNYSSASAIRQTLATTSLDAIFNQIPESCVSILETAYQNRFPMVSNDFSLLLKYKLMTESKESLTTYADVSTELANRIVNQLNSFENYEQFCTLLKTREVTYARISRALLHIMLNIKTDSYHEISYARVLGFNKQDSDILTELKKQAQVPLLTKLTATDSLTESGCQMLRDDIFASNLYESVVSNKFHAQYMNELQKQIVIVQ